MMRSGALGLIGTVRRGTLRLVVRTVLVSVVAVTAARCIEAATVQGGVRLTVAAAVVAAVVAAGFAPLSRLVLAAVERLLSLPSYDMASMLLELSADLSRVGIDEIGPLTVRRLSTALDFSFASLVTQDADWYDVHPHTPMPAGMRASLLDRARALLATRRLAAGMVEVVEQLPVLFQPLADEHLTSAVLCLGPRRGGEAYSAQDRQLLGILGRYIAVLFYKAQLRERLDQQVVTLRDLAQERAALADLILATAGNERQQLAGILHDDAIQMACEVVRQIDDIMARPEIPLDVHVDLGAVGGLGDELVGRLREVAGELYPSPLRTAGLLPTLHTYLEEAETGSGVRCTLDVDPVFEQMVLPAEHEVAIYRIVREAVSNALHHGHPTRVDVGVHRHGGQLQVAIRDDGDGFTPRPEDVWLAQGHLGLALLHQRARDLGGIVGVSSAPGKGTTVLVRTPWSGTDSVQGANT